MNPQPVKYRIWQSAECLRCHAVLQADTRLELLDKIRAHEHEAHPNE